MEWAISTLLPQILFRLDTRCFLSSLSEIQRASFLTAMFTLFLSTSFVWSLPHRPRTRDIAEQLQLVDLDGDDAVFVAG